MKKFLFLTFCAINTIVYAQNSIALDFENQHIVYSLKDISKVYFENDVMVINLVNDTEIRYNVALLETTSYNNDEPTALIQVLDEVNKLPFNIYPNPVETELNISFHLENTSKILIELYGMNGQLEKVLYNNSIIAGNETLNLNASDVVSGNHILRVSNGKIAITKLLIKK